MFNLSEFKWNWSGTDYHEIGMSRYWFFPGNRKCLEVRLYTEDCDGDFCLWYIKDDQKNNLFYGRVRDSGEALVELKNGLEHINNNIHTYLRDYESKYPRVRH
jgi:hypothetical protein